MPDCYKHAAEGIKISWDVGVNCPLCTALDERAALQEKLERAITDSSTLREKFQEIMEDAAGVKPPASVSRRRRAGFQAPVSQDVFGEFPDLDDEDY